MGVAEGAVVELEKTPRKCDCCTNVLGRIHAILMTRTLCHMLARWVRAVP